VAEKSFSGPMFSEITDAFPGQPLLDRTSMNTWEDAAVIDEINRIGKDRLVFAGLWTSVCIVGPVLSALEQGFETYVITDASGDVSDEAHERAVERMVQAGREADHLAAIPARTPARLGAGETYDLTTGIARKWGGGYYGLGITYARAMFNASEGAH
jgi:hypothetical protein